MANPYHIFIDSNVLVNYKTGQPKDVACLNFNFLFAKISVSDFSTNDLKEAISLKYRDIEDNIQYIISKKAKCNLIITNNTKDFAEILDTEIMKPERISMLKKKLS